MKNISRSKFIKNAALNVSALSLMGLSKTHEQRQRLTPPEQNLPREVWIASLTQHKMEGRNCEEVIQAALKQAEHALPFSPDIICLPEAFHEAGVTGGRPSIEKVAEDGSGRLVGPFQQFAKTNNCNVICPIYSREAKWYYNAAYVIDRQGEILGQYRKIKPTVGEMERGIVPGPEDPPVFKMDFGTIGIQTCFDIEWADGWRKLSKKGAELVFWPSAYGGGKVVNTMAWQHKYPVVSSTRKGTTKICDITGVELSASGNYNKWGTCAPINLEKVFLHSWPYNRHFEAIQQKYGKKVRIYTLHEEEFSIIESLSPDVKVADVMQEFNLKTYKEHIQAAENLHNEFHS